MEKGKKTLPTLKNILIIPQANLREHAEAVAIRSVNEGGPNNEISEEVRRAIFAKNLIL